MRRRLPLMAPSGGVAFGGLCGRSMSVHGAFETCRLAIRTSIHQRSTEVVGLSSKRRFCPGAEVVMFVRQRYAPKWLRRHCPHPGSRLGLS